MDEKGFRKFLKEGKRVPKNLSETVIRSNIAMVKEFEGFLRKKSPKRDLSDARERDVRAFMRHLSKDGRNTFGNLISILRFSRFSGNKDIELSLLTMLDGGNVLVQFCDNIRRKYGRRKADKVLGGFVPPPIGTSPKKMPKSTGEFLDRLESGIGRDAAIQLLMDSPHAGLPEAYSEEKKMLKASKDVDEYLRRRHRGFVKELEGHMKAKTLFFTQPITKEVLDFVKSNQEIGGGVRKGNTIYCTKIPYMTAEYLKAKDKRLKRYQYCHCPLARESILSGEELSHSLCYCSAGYEKRPFDIAFGEPVKIEVMETALWGDAVCRFAIEIPERYRKRSG